jgi:hypothetical protein
VNRLNNCNEYYSADLEIRKLMCRDLYLIKDGPKIYWVKHCGIPCCGECAIPARVEVVARIKRVLAGNARIPCIDNL